MAHPKSKNTDEWNALAQHQQEVANRKISLEHEKKRQQIRTHGRSLRNTMAENEKNTASLMGK